MVNPIEYNWVQQAKQGNRAAIEELYHRYWHAARASAYGVTGDLSLAEDAASEAFCVALQGLGGLDDPGKFGPWLRTIVVRSARRVKTGRAKVKGPEDVSDAIAHAPGAKMEQEELTILIRQAVGRLPDRLREAVSLFYFEGYDLKEAALFLDVPIGTLKRRLHEARFRLRDAASVIIEGRRPMDPNQDHVIQKLRDLFHQEPEPARDALFAAVREAMQLHPFPRELFAEFWRQRMQKKRESHPASPRVCLVDTCMRPGPGWSRMTMVRCLHRRRL